MKNLAEIVAKIEKHTNTPDISDAAAGELAWSVPITLLDYRRLCAAFRAAQEMKAEWFKYHAAEYDFDMDDNTPEQAKAKMAEIAECMKRFHKAAAAWDAACKGDE